jgi:hypothetical protein
MGLRRNKPLAIAPLASPISKLTVPLTQATTSSQFAPSRDVSAAVAPTLTGAEVRKMLASPTKLREVALLTEILQPPLALRHRRRP